MDNKKRYSKYKESFKKSHDNYMANYSELKARVPKDKADEIKAYCKEHGLSVSAFLNNLINNYKFNN